MTELREDFLEPSLDRISEDPQVVVIDFSATWCGPCKRQTPVFKRVAREIQDQDADRPVAFLTVDVDRNQALAQRHRVKSVPTTVIVAKENGLIWGESWQVKKRFSGVIPYPRLMAAVQEQIDDL